MSLTVYRYIHQMLIMNGLNQRMMTLLRLPSYLHTRNGIIRFIKLLLYPGAFNMASGPVHWKRLISSRLIVDMYIYFVNHLIILQCYFVNYCSSQVLLT